VLLELGMQQAIGVACDFFPAALAALIIQIERGLVIQNFAQRIGLDSMEFAIEQGACGEVMQNIRYGVHQSS